MADSNLTIRIPEALKARLLTACERSFQTQSDFIQAAISQRIDGQCQACGRDGGAVVMQPAGMTDAFERWARELTPTATSDSGPVTIATQEAGGAQLYHGSFLGSGLHPSFLYLRPEQPGKPYLFDRIPIARVHITMWAHHEGADTLRTRLRARAHFDVTAALFSSLPDPLPAPTRRDALRGRRGQP